VKLSPQSNSGESGTATLIKQSEKQTKVTLDVTGASGSQPVHIHKGTCAQGCAEIKREYNTTLWAAGATSGYLRPAPPCSHSWGSSNRHFD
jgi:hypothetical protein